MDEIQLKPSYWASVSGGKDSLFMLKLILEHPEKYPLDGVVHFELEIDYPFIKGVIDYMEEQCKQHGIKFVRIKPEHTWLELYNKWGFPTRKGRWCNSNYKLNAKKQLKKYLKEQGCNLINYIGYCADEVKRIEKHKENDIYPLYDFGIEESTILEWAKTVPLFNDYYKYNTRCGCMYCPLMNKGRMAYIKLYYPEHFEKMMKLAKETEQLREKELERPFSVWASNPKYNTDYMINIINNKYLPKLKGETSC